MGLRPEPQLAGNVEFRDVTTQAVDRERAAEAPRTVSLRGVAVADVTADSRPDVVSSDGASIWVWLNAGRTANRSMRVDLRGLVSNRSGVGAKVQVRAGSLSARLDVSASTPAIAPVDLLFGLGRRSGADAARVLWPSGILQAEVASPATAGSADLLPSRFQVAELDRKPSSCPFLFTWNGSVSSSSPISSAAARWVLDGPGHLHQPDPVEYVRIRGDQLRPRNDGSSSGSRTSSRRRSFLDRVQLLCDRASTRARCLPERGHDRSAEAVPAVHAVTAPRRAGAGRRRTRPRCDRSASPRSIADIRTTSR